MSHKELAKIQQIAKQTKDPAIAKFENEIKEYFEQNTSLEQWYENLLERLDKMVQEGYIPIGFEYRKPNEKMDVDWAKMSALEHNITVPMKETIDYKALELMLEANNIEIIKKPTKGSFFQKKKKDE